MEVRLLLGTYIAYYKDTFHDIFKFIEEMVKMREPLVARIDGVINFIVEYYNIDVERESINTILSDMYSFYKSFDYRFNNVSTGVLRNYLKNIEDSVLTPDWFIEYKSVMLDEEITDSKEIFLNSMNYMKQKLLNLDYEVGFANYMILTTALLKLRD